MSRAFTKEIDDDVATDELPARPVSPNPNYVTPMGARLLHDKVRELQALRHELTGSDDIAIRQRLKSVERDLRYYDERARTAVLVNPSTQSDNHVHFGSTVEVVDPEDNTLCFSIVGEDEADVTSGKISWVSPLARALMDAQVNDTVIWQRPAGDIELTVVSIRRGSA